MVQKIFTLMYSYLPIMISRLLLLIMLLLLLLALVTMFESGFRQMPQV
jgi:hypothetical protein